MTNIFKIFIISLLLFSCTNPFSVRDAEVPSGNSDTFDDPRQEEIVLSNLRFAMIQKNATNYSRCFVDYGYNSIQKFKFIHDQRINDERINNWTYSDEKEYFRTITTRDSLISINFDIIDSLSFNSILPQERDSVWTNFNYVITLNFKNSNFEYRGQSIIKLVKDTVNPLWSIYYWEDLPGNDNYIETWSILKLKFR